MTACLAQNSLVYSLCACLPVSRTSVQLRAMVARLNKTSVSHSAPPDWTPTVPTVHNEPKLGCLAFSFSAPTVECRKVEGGGMQGVAGCTSVLTDGGHETT